MASSNKCEAESYILYKKGEGDERRKTRREKMKTRERDCDLKTWVTLSVTANMTMG